MAHFGISGTSAGVPETSSSGGNGGYQEVETQAWSSYTNTRKSQPSSTGEGLIDPGFHPELANIQDQALRNALAASDDAAYGIGEITDTTYNEDGTFTYDQTARNY